MFKNIFHRTNINMQAEEVTNWLSMCKSCNAMQLHHISSFKVQEIFMWLDLCRYRKKIEQVIDNLGWSKQIKVNMRTWRIRMPRILHHCRVCRRSLVEWSLYTCQLHSKEEYQIVDIKIYKMIKAFFYKLWCQLEDNTIRNAIGAFCCKSIHAVAL